MTINVGFLAFAIAALTGLGVAGAGRNTNYQIARTASVGNILQRAAQDVTDADRRLRFTLAVVSGSALALLVGLLLMASAGR